MALARRLPWEARLAAISAVLRVASSDEAETWGVELIELAAGGAGGLPTDRSGTSRGLARLFEFATARTEANRRDRADRALKEVVRLWAVLPPHVRKAAQVVARGRARGVIASILSASDADSRLSAAAFIQDCLDPELIPAAASLASDREADVSREGEHALLSTAAAALASGDPRLRRVVELALAHLVESMSGHKRPAVFALAAELLDLKALRPGPPQGPLAKWFLDADHHGRMALRSAIRRGEGPLTRLRAWEWLKVDDLAPAAAERLTRPASADEHAAVLHAAHLGVNPARARRARALTPARRRSIHAGPASTSRAIPPAAVVAELDARARRALPRWLVLARADDDTAEALLSPLIADGDPMTRLGAVTHLPRSAISDFCFDPDPTIARSAALRWLGVDSSSARSADRTLGFLSRAAHPDLRAWASRARERDDPWSGRTPQALLCARRAMEQDRAAFLGLLRDRLRDDGSPDRLGAVMLARRLGLHAEVELELLALAHAPGSPGLGPTNSDGGSDPERVVSAAVAALGETRSPAASSAVRACLSHPIDRARASAVESALRSTRGDAARSDPALYSAAMELKGDAHHRVRANALRGLLRAAYGGYEPAAVEGLAAMLADDRPMHRLAGVWLAQRTLADPAGPSVRHRSAELASRVADLARGDGDSAVRSRAGRCLRSLAARTRFGWEERAPELSTAGGGGGGAQ